MSISANRIVRGFLLAAALIGVVGSLTYVNSLRLQELSRIVDETQEALTASEAVRRNLLEAEFSARAMAQTLGPAFATRYESNATALGESMARLRQISTGDQTQRAVLDSIEPLIARRLEQFSGIVGSALEGDQDTATAATLTIVRSEDPLREQLDQAIDDYQSDVRLLLEDQQAAESDRVRQVRFMVLAAVLASALFLGLATVFVIRQLRAARRAEAEIRISEERYRDLFENASDLIQSVDVHGRFAYVNRAWSAKLGYSPEEAGRMQFLEVVHPSSTEHCRELFARLMKGEAVDTIEAVFQTKDGRPIEVEGKISCSYRDGHLISTRGIFRDLTERKQEAAALRAAEERFREIFEGSVEGLFQLTPDGKLLAANAAIARTLGYESADELIESINEGRRPLHASKRELIRLLRALEADGQVHEYEHRLLRKDGEIVWIAGSGRARFDDNGKLAYFEGNIADISQRKKAEAALRASEQRFRTLADNAPVGIFLTNPVGQCVLVNDRYIKITGLSMATALGKGWLEGVHPDDEDNVAQVWMDATVDEREFACEYRQVRPNGQIVWVSGRAAALTSEQGRLQGYVGTVSDATARKVAELERDRFFNMSLDTLCILDFDGSIRRLNPAGKQTLGFAIDEMIGAHYASFIHPDDAVSVAEQLLALKAGNGFVQFEARYLTRQSGYRWLSWNAVGDADQKLIYATARDVTDKRRLREELQTKNSQLREQNLRVEKATRMKSEFLANMSHELRTPLNGIIGFAELMRDGRAGPVSDMHQEFLDDILTSSRHLLQLINDILDLSKVEAGKMEFQPERVRLERLVAEVCEVVRELAARNRVQFVTEIDAKVDEVELDPGKTKQVLYNYLSNAIKFTHGGTVTVRAYPVDDQFFRVEVEDTGIGISAEDQRRLFAEFQQLDEGAAKKYQGTGLGLALTKRIVEAQGGMVGVESTPGQGSTFFAILPLRAPGGGNGVQAKPADARARLVLVVEDDPVDAQTLVDTLEGAGYRAIVASTGTDAIQEVNRRHFDAVTLDLLLPDMAGWNVLKAIQSSELNADTVTIVVSVSSDQGMARGFKVNGTIAKPVDKDHLLGTLRNAGIWPNLSRRVLVVDDDPSVLKLMETSLTDLGYVPVCVGTAEAGALVVQHDKPDAVILDFMLPGMSGLEFLSTFRQNPDHVDVPVVLWTNKDLDKKELAKLKHLGTQVVLKRSGGIRSLLEEIQERLQVPPVTTSDRESGGDR